MKKLLLADLIFMKGTILCLLLGGLLAACSTPETKAKKAAPDELFFVSTRKDDKIIKGFMDKTGKIVIGPFESFEWNGRKYENSGSLWYELMPFIEGLAGICFYDKIDVDVNRENAKCGFIDKTGKIAVEPKYRSISYFSEGLAAVSEDDKKYGYIDKTGKMVIEQKFFTSSPFSEGLAAVYEEPAVSKKGYIDKTGKFVIEPKYQAATSFGDGHAIVETDAQRIIIDKTGKELKTFDATAIAGNSKYRYKNLTSYPFYKADGGGEYEIEESAMMPSFSEGLTMLSNYSKSEPLGYAKTDGAFEIKLDAKQVGELRPFADGLAPIGLDIITKDTAAQAASSDEKSYEWAFVDRKGDFKYLNGLTFWNARPFSEGLAAVFERGGGGRWFFITTEMQTATPACYEGVSDFRGGLAYAKIDTSAKGCEQYADLDSSDRYAYIDKTGRVVKPQW